MTAKCCRAHGHGSIRITHDLRTGIVEDCIDRVIARGHACTGCREYVARTFHWRAASRKVHLDFHARCAWLIASYGRDDHVLRTAGHNRMRSWRCDYDGSRAIVFVHDDIVEVHRPARE